MEPIELLCPVMHYDWGRRGSDSLVARLSKKAIDEDVPYAELWLGAHPKASSCLWSNPEITLAEHITATPKQLLGAGILKQFGPALPFLGKILSIGQPLSIQAHPSAEQAVALHSSDPDRYPDANHKPEVAIALTEVELLHELCSEEELESSFRAAPELMQLFDATQLRDPRECFTALISCSEEKISDACRTIWSRLSVQQELTRKEQWVLRMREQFPEGDVGVLCFYVMKLKILSRGEAIYTSPGVPHAYLSGDLYECLANSDNVVRVGLTAKYRDAETLKDILVPRATEFVHQDVGAPPPFAVSDPGEHFRRVVKYDSPAQEFAVWLQEGAHDYSFSTVGDGPVILFSVDARGEIKSDSGACYTVEPGTAIFLPAEACRGRMSIASGMLVLASVGL